MLGRFRDFALAVSKYLFATGSPAPRPWSVAIPPGSPGNGDSFSTAVSTNGQFVLFESAASDLVNGDNNQTDVFLRDLLSQNTVLISANTNGFAGNGFSHNAVMTPDAHFIAFSSAASDLVAADTNGIPTYLSVIVLRLPALVSIGALGRIVIITQLSLRSPDITPDGRFVSFYSSATNVLRA